MTDARAARLATRITATTATGSRYTVIEHDGRFWMVAENLPNAESTALRHGRWEIRRPEPWPPSIGAPWRLIALPLAADDPERVPGGGKVTSEVVAVERAEFDPADLPR